MMLQIGGPVEYSFWIRIIDLKAIGSYPDKYGKWDKFEKSMEIGQPLPPISSHYSLMAKYLFR